MKSWVLFLALLLPVLAAGGLFFLALRSAKVVPEVGLVDGRLRPLPKTPNCVSSEQGTAEDARVEPLPFRGSAEGAQNALVDLLTETPRVEIETSQPGYVHAVFRTAVFGFRDDVEFRIDEETRTIHVRSAARVGHSDLGANRGRVEALRERWMAPSAQ